jgi:starch synthase
MEDPLKIFILASEAVPFAKTGGLADVAGSLPAALKRLGVDVRLCLPRYRMSFEKNHHMRPLLEDLDIPLGEAMLRANILETRSHDKIPVYLIDREDMYDRPNLYGNEKGDYYDNLERFTFFAHCTLKMIQRLGLIPDIIHCHDWQAGLVPALLKGPYKKSPPFSRTASVFTIHNLGYQGIFPAKKFPVIGLNAADFFHPDGVEFWGNVSLLKAGIVYADAVTTVSPTYSQEIQTPEYGMGMEGILQNRRESLYGILNGVDYNEWNPAKDIHIAANYSWKRMTGKKQCKESLIQEMNLDPSLITKPLLGMISRLDAQKGLDILVAMLDKILTLDMGLVILGSGDAKIQAALKKAADKHSKKIGIYIGFNESLAHQIMAGADIFLIPSRYEPCGLTQMYALKYGTVPVVRATGGLNDTITPFNKGTGEGNGFRFGPYDAKAFFGAIQQAVRVYKDQQTWKKIQANGMQKDFSWDRSAEMYAEIYQTVLKKK